MNILQYWALPPVVGEISDYQAIILCEPNDKFLPLSCSITGSDNYNLENIISVETDGPTRVLIKFPRITQIFTVEWTQILTQDSRRLIYTHQINTSNNCNKLIFVSCDLLEADIEPADSMWSHMLDEILPNKQIGLIHLGDQAYMDKVFKDCVTLAHRRGHNDITATQIMRSFAKRYIDTWVPHHNVLSHVTNYHLWDDHELRDNMTLMDQVSDDEKYVRDLATQAYITYQASLHLNNNNIITDFSWCKRMGDLLIIAIERTSQIISVEQILQSINEQTESNETTRLILCFASAPIPVRGGFYGFLYDLFIGRQEVSRLWSIEDLELLYNGLFDWIENAIYREVIVIGGDLHFSVYANVRRNNLSIPVIISSPITNQPTPDCWAGAKAMKGAHRIGENIIFNTLNSQSRRCYAIVDLDTTPMKITMHYSTRKIPANTIRYLKTLWSF